MSKARKDGADEELAKYDGVWKIGAPTKTVLTGDFGLIAQSRARHHAIAASLKQPLKAKEHEEIIIQYVFVLLM